MYIYHYTNNTRYPQSVVLNLLQFATRLCRAGNFQKLAFFNPCVALKFFRINKLLACAADLKLLTWRQIQTVENKKTTSQTQQQTNVVRTVIDIIPINP